MGAYSITRVAQSMTAIRDYIEAETDKSTSSVLGRTSGFWQVEFAARPNYPSVSDYLAFRREGFTHGMADGFSFFNVSRSPFIRSASALLVGPRLEPIELTAL